MAKLEGTAAVGGSTITVSDRCTTVWIECKSTSANSLLVDIPSVQPDGYEYELEPGVGQAFRCTNRGIASFVLKGDGGDATYRWTPVAVTDPFDV